MLSVRSVARVARARGSFPVKQYPAGRNQTRLLSRSAPRAEANTATSRAQVSNVDGNAGNSSGTSSAVVGGLVGGGAVFLLAYSWYHFSGAKSAINSLSQAKEYAQSVTEKVKQKAPEPNQAIKWLRETTQTYASFVPGAKGYVDKAFDDLDLVYDRHGSQVDEIVSKTYEELGRVAKEKGASLDGMYAAWSALEKAIREIGSLSSDAANDIMKNHPELQETLGHSFETLQSMGQNLGSEASDEVKKTFDQVREVFSKGVTSDAVQKAKSIIEDKSRVLRQKSDDLWQKGMQQAQPYLDKNPQIKKIVEENKDTLKQGNLSHLWAQVRGAADSGATEDLQSFVEHAKDQVKSKSSGSTSSDAGSIGSLVSMFGGSDVMSKIQSLAEMTQKNGKEAEELLKGTVDDIKSVIQKRTEEAERLAAKSGNGKN